MNTYKRHRFPPDIISYAVWLYYRFNLSHRDIEDLQAKRNGAAAKRFFRRLLCSHGAEPRKIVTDKLRGYGVAHRELLPETIHSTQQYENNRAEQSHESTRVRERGMRRCKSMIQAQRFVTAHAAVSNLFNLGRHLIRAQRYRDLRVIAFDEWSRAVA
ncbi:MAG: transposase [Halioglobus sp.]